MPPDPNLAISRSYDIQDLLNASLASSFDLTTIRRMSATKAELTECHDCGGAVSFRAANCPHCGSLEPAGAYVFNRKEARRHRIEERNDRNLVVVALSCGLVGGLYGAGGSASMLGAVLAGFSYGMLGVMIGVPIAFAINITRHIVR
jgi:hypothetical protein